MTKPTASSTPAPQGESELLQERGQQINKLARELVETREERQRALVQRDEMYDKYQEEMSQRFALEKKLVRERESRKQAEAALRKAHEQTEQAAHNLCTCVNRSTWSCNACMSLLPIERTLSAVLAVQEPAEPERGK